MRKRIGDFLIEKGVLTQSQVDPILRYSAQNSLRFGDAALEMGLLTRDQLIQVFGPSFAVDFFHLEPQYFPQITKELLPVELLVRLGVMPLGFKTERKLFRTRKILNLGMLDPSRRDAVDEATRAAVLKVGDGGIQGVKVFLVLADQFLGVLDHVYGQKEAHFKNLDPSQLDGTLSLFLENAH